MQVTPVSRCWWAACQSPQLEAVLAQALLELAVTPDNCLSEGVLETIRWFAAAQVCALLPVTSAGTDITYGIMVQPAGSASTADHCVLVQKDISVCPTLRPRLHAAPRQVCFCFHL